MKMPVTPERVILSQLSAKELTELHPEILASGLTFGLLTARQTLLAQRRVPEGTVGIIENALRRRGVKFSPRVR